MKDVEIIKPSNLPFKCPVCNGFGTLKYGELVCKSCDGKGYVVIPQDRQTEYEENK